MKRQRTSAIILGAGKGTRLQGIAAPYGKTTLPVNDLPVIGYAARAVEKYVDQIVVVGHPSTAETVVAAVQQSLRQSHLPILLALQHEARGMGDAMRIGFAAAVDHGGPDGPAVVLAGDNIVLDDQNVAAVLAALDPAQPVELAWTFRELDPPESRRFSVYRPLDERRGELVEKPETPPSRRCWCGPVAFGSAAIALERCETLTPSARGEYEATDLMNTYLRQGTGRALPLQGAWFDVGTPAALREAEAFIAEQAGGSG